MQRGWLVGWMVLAGCTGRMSSTPGRTGSDAGAGVPRDAGRGASPDARAGDAGDVAPRAADDAGPLSDGTMSGMVTCSSTPPPGSPAPPAPPTYAGTCPALVDGHNDLTSSGHTRNFRLVLPAGYDVSRSYPLFFLWHWLRGNADGFYGTGDLQTAADSQHFIAVIPEAKGDLEYTWPFTILDSSSRIHEELQFFDDMLACVSAQFSVNDRCVTSVGVSAGALWTDELAGQRGQYLSSFISLSGGTGGSYVVPWHASPHKMAALVLWGGPSDTCVVDMAAASRDLESHLGSDGHFLVECVHNCGHSAPPIMGTSTLLAPLWEFVLAHPYWLPAGTSPYDVTGLPADFPDWCGIGAGGATIRTGACSGSAC